MQCCGAEPFLFCLAPAPQHWTPQPILHRRPSDLYSGGTGAGGLSDHRPHGVRGERGHILRDAYNNKWGFNILQNVHGTLLWFAVELD